jgi:HD-GYP domain-containing protein (c-di-GMP phosphodiesterase class II)
MLEERMMDVGMVEVVNAALDSRLPGSDAHARHVRAYALMLARAHGVDDAELADLECGALLHDVGKIGLPDSLLEQDGPLSPAEWKLMCTHPEIGYRVLQCSAALRGAASIVLHHHERWDGAGYPCGLRGEAIPLGARIVAIADTLDAVTVERRYRSALSLAAARDEIARGRGTHFDPAVVETFLSLSARTLSAAECGGPSPSAPRHSASVPAAVAP